MISFLKLLNLGSSPVGKVEITDVNSIAELKAINTGNNGYGAPLVEDGSIVNVDGYYSQNDGGGGVFIFSAYSSAADDGGVTIAPTSGLGRWIRQVSSPINAKWFGALGNGVQNDYSFIQAAITYVESLTNGGTILIPAGIYTIGTGLVISALKNIRIYGEGWGATTIKPTAAISAFTVGVSTVDRTCDVRLENFLINGNALCTTGVYIRRVHNMKLNRLRISATTIAGISLDRAYANIISECYVNNNTGDGIIANAQNDFTRIQNCALLANTGNGVYFSDGNSSGSVIENCDIEGNGIGILLNAGAGQQTQDFRIHGCYFESQVGLNISAGTDVSAYFYDGLVIAQCNTLSGAGTHTTNGVKLDRCRRPLVIGNTFADSDLIVTANTNYPVFMGNRFSGTSVFPTGLTSGINLCHSAGVDFQSDAAGNVRFGTSADWPLKLSTNGIERWRVGDSADLYSLISAAGSFIENAEIADPAAPAADRGRLYFKDNGAGKTQMCVRFATGAIQVIATQP